MSLLYVYVCAAYVNVAYVSVVYVFAAYVNVAVVYGKPFEHLFHILDIQLVIHVLVSSLSSLVTQFSALVEQLELTSKKNFSHY